MLQTVKKLMVVTMAVALSQLLMAPASMAKEEKKPLPKAMLEHATKRPDGRTTLRYSVDSAQLKQLREGKVPDEQDRKLIDHHVEKAMREGHVLAADDIDVVGFDIPNVASVHLVQDKHDHLGGFKAEVTSGDNGEILLEIAAVAVAADDDGVPPGNSAGFDAGSGNGSAVLKGSGSRTIYFQPAYPHTADHWITTNWEKWQNTKSGYQTNWVYNRYATFDAGNGSSGWRGEIVDATIRSRPWSGYESRVIGGPYSYTPRPQETCQSVATVTLNAGSYASVTIPVVNCYSGQEIYPNGNEHSMGTAFYGRTTAQRYLDFGFSFKTASATTSPIYADYVYMSVEYCIDPYRCTSLNPNQNLKWTDSGW